VFQKSISTSITKEIGVADVIVSNPLVEVAGIEPKHVLS
jgi:hypothetical protein